MTISNEEVVSHIYDHIHIIKWMQFSSHVNIQ